MNSCDIQVRVRYCDVDRMGYMHHGNYAAYFEMGRTELLRLQGLSYREMEDRGIILPVRTMNVQYTRPAFYDELITIRTILEEMEGVRLLFRYSVLNENNETLCEATTTLVFADAKTGKPRRAPDFFIELFD